VWLNVFGRCLVDLGDVLDVLGWQRLEGYVDRGQWCGVGELAVESKRTKLEVEAPESDIVRDDNRDKRRQRGVRLEGLEQTAASTAALTDELGGSLARAQQPLDVCWAI
jgi:hypothetical protein